MLARHLRRWAGQSAVKQCRFTPSKRRARAEKPKRGELTKKNKPAGRHLKSHSS
ncbi:hypothetical protein KCP77_07990 [Salmonella enterica subsp. enterica]|nr:hypothetical protein KCP77_07990 [Salmonella enterica subsp. enterica]